MNTAAEPAPRTLEVDLGERRYPIHIGSGVLGRGAGLSDYLPGNQVLIVTNETVGPHYVEALRHNLNGYQIGVVELPDGERYKDLATLDRIYDQLLAHAFDRDCAIVALGGGVIGDMAGFAAATYQRGVAYVQVPTTLLAMVDSAVGGKTGVNHRRGKNMIGAFHQPRSVLADPAVLATLPDRELSAGIAEVIKYGLLGDYPFLEWLEANMAALRAREPAPVAEAIETSCRNKAAIVAADEREAGQRALLNLGHTFAHAIETATGYSTWLHGEAVAAGLCMAGRMSYHCGWLSEDAFKRIQALVQRAGLPTRPPPMEQARYHELMRVDKKAKQGQLRLVLISELGQAFVTGDFPARALEATLAEYQRPS